MGASAESETRGSDRNTRLAGWVLVGGESRRMGRDKALMPVGGQVLAMAVADALRSTGAEVALVGDPEKYGFLGLPVIPDRFRGAGPLAGIEAALAATAADWNLFAACDMPGLDRSLLQELVRVALADPELEAVVPRYPDGLIEPVCAAYHRRGQAVAADALAAGVRIVADFIARLKVRYVEVPQAGGRLSNLNTPEDLENYRRG